MKEPTKSIKVSESNYIPRFHNVNHTDFNRAIRTKVQAYFESRKKSQTGNWSLYFKAILLWLSYFLLYTHLVFFTPNPWLGILECLVLGILTAGIGFNVMHDGGHGSFSNSKFINFIAANSVNLLGASALMWHTKHNVIHHTYTNIAGVDDDIDLKPFVRMSPAQDRYLLHRFQFIYVWMLYPLLLIFWVFYSDFRKYFSGKIGIIKIQNFKITQHFTFWLAKIVYFVIMLVIPIYFVGFLPWLIGYLVLSFTAGLILSVVFQLAHTVEEASFPEPTETTHEIENEWAIHQVNTTVNFATKSKMVSWFVGGLNFQIEHHLFPKISHVHYPAISKIIRETCDEFQIKYNEYSNVWNAIVSHTRHLKKMGIA